MNFFDDNVRVGDYEDRTDFLSVSFRDLDKDRPEFPWIISLTRYSVPGRYDTYNFDYAPSPGCGIGNRVRYFTDTQTPLADALKLLQKDLNKKKVVEMLLKAAKLHRYFARILYSDLLACVGPKTKAYEAFKELIEKGKPNV